MLCLDVVWEVRKPYFGKGEGVGILASQVINMITTLTPPPPHPEMYIAFD